MVAEIMIQVLVAIWQNDNHSLSNERIMTGLKVLAVLDNGLVHLRAVVSEEVHQPAEDLDHVLKHGRRPCGGPWRTLLVLSRQLVSGHTGVVFDVPRQS